MIDQAIARGTLCPTCGRYKDRHVVTDALIIHGEKILLIKRGIPPEKGHWALPGGHLNWDETVERSAVREAEEETGTKVTIRGFLGVYSHPDRDSNQNVSLAYVMQVLDDAFQRQESEVEDVQWFSLDSLPDTIAFDHKQIIEDYTHSPYALR